ncbi:MAG: GUN4 domain-containing protein, partial [Dolichospermum sp.]
IVASLYSQLNDLDKSNTVYYESLKAHLLAGLDYLMQQDRWEDADFKNWQFILVSAKREKERYLFLNDIKKFNCKNLKELDSLWVNNSNKKFGYSKFGYSVQKEIYLETGNSLDFDWEKGEFTKWSDQKWNNFTKSVGWTEKTYTKGTLPFNYFLVLNGAGIVKFQYETISPIFLKKF